MGKIYLIRHGETDSNKSHRFQGSLELPLNGVGLAQARAMAKYMEQYDIDAVYCSSMLRARMTAAELAMSKNIAYRPLDSLREISFGDWEGLEYAEINRRWPEEMKNFLTMPSKWIPPGGESFVEAYARCQKALADILAEVGDKNIAIVSHGGIIRLQLCIALNMPLDSLWKLNVYNASVSRLTNSDGYLIGDFINVADFLKTDFESALLKLAK